mgnify:CR=1 FL=1
MHPTAAPNCRICPYRQACLFSSLDEASKKEWIVLRKARIFYRGTTVFFEGDEAQGVYIVCEGKVKMFKSTRMGRSLTTKVLPPGSLFGHRSLLAGESYSTNTEAFADAVVSRIDEKSFLGFLRRHWPAVMVIIKQLARSVREGEDRAREIAFSTARARLAQALLASARKSDGQLIVHTPRKELAQIAGIVPETCVRLLRKLAASGLLKRESRKALIILKLTDLRSIAGGALVSSQ